MSTSSTLIANSALEERLHKIAHKIVELRLESPVNFFLEIHIPITTLLHTTTLMFQPIASPLFGAERISTLEQILADKKNISRLIELIETYSVAKKAKK
jgi:hypothetical protein